MNLRRALVAGAAVVLVGTAAPSAAATPSAPRAEVLAETARVRVVQQGEWVRHEYRRAMPGSTVVEWRGERIWSGARAGCGYRQSATEAAAAPGTVRLERQVAANLSRCILRMEVADLTATQAAAFRPVGTSGTSATASSPSAAGPPTRATTTGRYQKLFYEDPPQIDVTQTSARVRWTYTGSCTTWSSHNAHWGWYSPSGWDRVAHWWGYAGASCAYGATTSVTATYQNTWFCDGIPGSNSFDTWNRYNTNYVQGHSNGSVYYEWDAQNWGGCSNLLSFNRETGFWAG